MNAATAAPLATAIYTVPKLSVACEWRKLPEELVVITNPPILNRCRDDADCPEFGPCQCPLKHFEGTGRASGHGWQAFGSVNADGTCA